MPTLVAARVPTVKALALIERGLPWANAEALAGVLGVTLEALAALLDIPVATFYRRRKAGRFSKQESDHLMRFMRLWWLACDVFENEKGARSWLKAPQFGLGGAIPLQRAITEMGAHQVEELLHRIDAGVMA
jgi:putative toxin-antitoxin system antitoxin component (TIGR02293 family)